MPWPVRTRCSCDGRRARAAPRWAVGTSMGTSTGASMSTARAAARAGHARWGRTQLQNEVLRGDWGVNPSLASPAVLRSVGFDFFINLSDADVALRTNAEIVRFLHEVRGRSFVATKFPAADEMRYRAHAHMRRSSWLECDGEAGR